MDKVLPVWPCLRIDILKGPSSRGSFRQSARNRCLALSDVYYAEGGAATREVLPMELLELMSELAGLAHLRPSWTKLATPPSLRVGLFAHSRQREVNTLIGSGSETDVCVLATVLDAVDMGYRVVIVRDANAVRLTKDTSC